MSSLSRTSGRTCTHPGVDEEGPREPVRRHWMMAMGKINTFALPSCAASFTCPPFTCRPPLPLGLPHQQQVSNGLRWPLTVTTRASMPRRTRISRVKGNSGSTRGAA